MSDSLIYTTDFKYQVIFDTGEVSVYRQQNAIKSFALLSAPGEKTKKLVLNKTTKAGIEGGPCASTSLN